MKNNIKTYAFFNEMKMIFKRPFINVHRYKHESKISYANATTNFFDIYYSNEQNNKNILLIDIHGGFFKYGKNIDNVNAYYNFLDNGIDVLSVEYTKKDVFLQIYEINKVLHFIKENSLLFNHEYKSVYLLGSDSASVLCLLQEINKYFKLDIPYKKYKIDGIILTNPIFNYKEYLHTLKLFKYFKELFSNSNSYDILLEKFDYTKYLEYIKCPILILTSASDIIKEDASSLNLKLNELNKEVFYYRVDDKFKKTHNMQFMYPKLKESKILNEKINEFIINGGILND